MKKIILIIMSLLMIFSCKASIRKLEESKSLTDMVEFLEKNGIDILKKETSNWGTGLGKVILECTNGNMSITVDEYKNEIFTTEEFTFGYYTFWSNSIGLLYQTMITLGVEASPDDPEVKELKNLFSLDEILWSGTVEVPWPIDDTFSKHLLLFTNNSDNTIKKIFGFAFIYDTSGNIINTIIIDMDIRDIYILNSWVNDKWVETELEIPPGESILIETAWAMEDDRYIMEGTEVPSAAYTVDSKKNVLDFLNTPPRFGSFHENPETPVIKWSPAMIEYTDGTSLTSW